MTKPVNPVSKPLILISQLVTLTPRSIWYHNQS